MIPKPGEASGSSRQKKAIVAGRLASARQSPTNHQDERPEGIRVSAVILHNISLPAGHFAGDYIEALFRGRLDCSLHPDFAGLEDLRVSAHLLIRRDGSIIQFVPFHKRAWHAGASSLEGQADCNDFSIGIELEGTDQLPYQQIQYLSLASVVRVLLMVYPELTKDRVVGHADVAPGRKTDPGPAFDWPYFHQLLG